MIPNIGFQAYSVKETMTDEASIRHTFGALAAAGYQNVQTAGCAVPYETYGRLAKEAGLEICGTHEDFDAMTADPRRAIENHRLLGTTNMGIGGYGMNTLEEVQAFIRRANAFAATIAKEGFKFTYHNHHMEYRRLQGKTIMEHLSDGLDPATTSFVLDTYWVQVGGGDVRRELERLAGRIDILHLKDLWLNPDGSHQSTEIGNGNLWWEGILPLAKETGVRYFVVEQEEFTMDPMESMRRSAAYLQSL